MSPALAGRSLTTEPSGKSTLAVVRINPSLDGKIPWRRERLPTPVFWPGEFHGQMSLADDSPWGCKESHTTKWLSLSLRSMETKLNVANLWLKAKLVLVKSLALRHPIPSSRYLPRSFCLSVPCLLSLSSEKSPPVLHYFMLSWALCLYPRDTCIPGTVILWLLHPTFLEF